MKHLRICLAVVSCLATMAGTCLAEPVEIVRDRWGIAHVFADSQPALFYGAGYAMAEDRLLQMLLLRSEADGRLSELLGPGEDDKNVASDRFYRVLGFARHARVQLEHVQPATRRNLDAFAAGINAYASENPDRLSKFADVFPQRPRPWEAADCIAVWSRHASQFSEGWKNEVASLRRYEEWVKTRQPGEKFPGGRLVRDDSAAVITEEEFQRSNPQVYERLKRIAATPAPEVGWFHTLPEEFKASHAWVVSGARSTTGKPILESNPQLPVAFPTAMYEIHLCGGGYDVRGIAFPGTPAIFIGWNRHCAWGATALGGDHADLFQEKVDPQNSAHYLFKGESRPFATRTETIQIKGREPLRMEIRETLHGPVANALLKDVKEGEVFALRHSVLASTHSSLEAQLTMIRADNWASFHEGMREFVAPACNMIFADDSGNIGYQSLVSTPKRRNYQPLPRRGWTGDDEWELVPFEEMPSLLNPRSNTIFSANHIPIGSWYPYLVTTSRGEGPRSWRLRELLAGDRKFSVEDFHNTIHLDAVNGGVRDFVKLATLVAREDGKVDPAMADAVAILEKWDGQMRTDAPAFPVAQAVLDVLLSQHDDAQSIFSQFGSQWAQYDGSYSGQNGLLKALTRAYRESGKAPGDPGVRNWLSETLLKAVRAGSSDAKYRPPITHAMPYQNNMGQLGSIAPQYDLVSPPLVCPITQTIWSQAGESFVQIVDLADVDRSLSLLPPGVSERPGEPHATDQIPLWISGRMHPAPLSRQAVLAVQESVRRLNWPQP